MLVFACKIILNFVHLRFLLQKNFINISDQHCSQSQFSLLIQVFNPIYSVQMGNISKQISSVYI